MLTKSAAILLVAYSSIVAHASAQQGQFRIHAGAETDQVTMPQRLVGDE